MIEYVDGIPMTESEKYQVSRTLDELSAICHHAARQWWYKDDGTNISPDMDALVGTKFALIHSEVSEALEGHRKQSADDKLPGRPMVEVELADALIRIFDLAGYLKLELGEALIEKMEYNSTRVDHTRAHRAAEGGKKY